jgi:hypothetical protein
LAALCLADPTKPKTVAPTAVNVMSGKTYEEEFEFETQRMKTGKQRSTPWYVQHIFA